ncbi:lipopolysaccharide biosynthesis protein [Devosia sp. SD17-2]|uniref:GumC family protein n=1 Tax=Devosia sp. SD17-2 TaxID=2976459 RepID=UPI0023D8171D|nr:lipopolysaccharide biosynthesis protein [Devosia sp. SD17-2]WEJ34192.1 lipopolysaccharide biosynthesis protein [Devosia sp. SD17-2]
MSNFDFGFYFALFRRRLPTFLTVLILAGAALFVAISLWPVSYRASARILVESPQIPTDLAKSTVPTGAAEQFQIIQEDVLSRESLLALADRFKLYASRPRMSETDIVTDMESRFAIDPIPVGTGSGATATVFQISFKADRPGTAATVVNELVAMILKKDVELRTERARETVTFFNAETARLNASLRLIEEQILSFKNENFSALPDSIDFRRNQQTTQQGRLLVLAQEEAGLNRRRLSLQSRPLSLMTNPVTPDEQTLASLRQLLVQQSAAFSDDSPTLVALRGRIDALEKSLMAPAPATTSGEADANGASGDTVADDDTAIQSSEMFDIRERLEEIADERAQLEKSLATLTASIEATPGIETALNSLQRNRQNLQAQYDVTVSRLAEASTGQQIELLLKGERLSLIESAVPPQRPQGPGQRLLILGGGLAALGIALATLVVPEFFNRRIRRPAELVSRLQITPYITVPYIERPAAGYSWLPRLIKRVGTKLGLGARRGPAPVPAPAFSASRKTTASR